MEPLPSSPHTPKGSLQGTSTPRDERQFYLGLWKVVMHGPWGGDSDPGQDSYPDDGDGGSTAITRRKTPSAAPRRKRSLAHA